MVFLTAGSGWLALMMRAERTRAGHEPPAAEWLLRDSETIEDGRAADGAAGGGVGVLGSSPVGEVFSEAPRPAPCAPLPSTARR